MQTAIVLGSARRRGNTEQLCRHASHQLAALPSCVRPVVFDLADYNIGAYDYLHRNRGDDFLPLMHDVMGFERIVLATPMYWYAPSGIMKTFLDRLSDLLTIEKDLGRQLRDKCVALLATGGDPSPPACFEDVFRLTWQHLGASHAGMLYCACPGDYDPLAHEGALSQFLRRLHAE